MREVLYEVLRRSGEGVEGAMGDPREGRSISQVSSLQITTPSDRVLPLSEIDVVRVLALAFAQACHYAPLGAFFTF
jgi:hypothetical protein